MSEVEDNESLIEAQAWDLESKAEHEAGASRAL
jgi:hypothetical protein